MRHFAAIMLLMIAGTPVFGASTGWTELAPGTRMRLIAAESWSAEGKTRIALEIDMPANTKTYWRVPGETGIPLEVDLSGSAGVTGHEVVWPYPEIDRQKGYTDFVYYGPTVIPIELSVAGDRPVVEASVLLGVCSDICVPATAHFSLPLAIGKADVGNDLRIAQAVAFAPIPWPHEPEPIGEAGLEPGGEVLSVAVDPATVDPSSVIADASDSGYLLGAPQKSPEPGVIRLPVLAQEGKRGLDAWPVRIVFMTRDGPFEVWRTVAP